MQHEKTSSPTDVGPLWPYLICILALCAAYIVMYWLHPTLSDDRSQLWGLRAYFEHPSLKTFFDSFCYEVEAWRLWDTARLSNWLITITLALPQVFTALIFGLSVPAMTYLGAKMAGIWRNNFFAFSVLSFLFTFGLPYIDCMFVRAYASNYILSSVISLVVLMFYIKGKPSSVLWAFLTGALVGAWHEGFASAMLAAVCVLAILWRDYRRPRNFAFITGLLVGMLYLMLAPGTMLRLSDHRVLTINLMGGIALGLPFYGLILLYISSLWIKKLKNVLWQPRPVAIFAAAAGGWLVWRIFILGGYRVAWPMLLYSYVEYAYLLATFTKSGRRGLNIAGGILWAIIMAHLIACIPWFYKLKKENEVLVMPWEWDDKPIYGPKINHFDVPLYTFGKPTFNISGIQNNWKCAVIPNELRDFDPADAEPIKSDNDAYIYDSYVVLTHNLDTDRQLGVALDVHFGDKVRHIFGVLTPFTTAKGNTYTWCVLRGVYLDANLHPITAVYVTGIQMF